MKRVLFLFFAGATLMGQEIPAPQDAPVTVHPVAFLVTLPIVNIGMLSVGISSLDPASLKLAIDQMSPAELRAEIGVMTPTQLAAFLQLLTQSNAGTLKLVLAAISTDKLKPLLAPQVAAILDINRWTPVLVWLASPANSRNWIAVEKECLNAAIKKSGCTPEILARAEAIISQTQ